MKKFISIFLLLYITLPINAQDKTNELSGFIIHKQENGSNGSLDGANIFLIYAKDTLKTTSINGVFRFKPIKTENPKVPQCPKEKEDAIKAALKYFAMI